MARDRGKYLTGPEVGALSCRGGAQGPLAPAPKSATDLVLQGPQDSKEEDIFLPQTILLWVYQIFMKE